MSAVRLGLTKVNKLQRLNIHHIRGLASDKVTHTGQQWEDNDYRLTRFVDKEKLVNQQFAIELINKVPPTPRKERVVWCDGGNEHLGHPRVYINLDKPGNHTCGYCGLRFYKEDCH
uniref:NADH ubiquinone oxidoreductase subunit, putative n=1 Tax=Riptortus pedestris TaxID=329032 RepID=R4WPJ1_RIPPE|nr:NADH ubiquinone oxidoreductase subunit, putative [Riptortus pedestris]